jgi:Ubiquitin carboxyl-terminal hydrolase
LHIYGLTAQENEDVETQFIFVCQRRSDLLSRDVLHPLSHRVFGIPLVFRRSVGEQLSGKQLYEYIALRLHAIVPKGAVAFLNQQHKASPVNGFQNELSTTADMEMAAGGPVPRFGFRLRRTSKDGRRCSGCPWYDCCIGCLIPDDESLVDMTRVETIAVDWHFAVDIATNGFGYRLPQSDPTVTRPLRPARVPPPVVIENHRSCGTLKKSGSLQGAVTLEDCLDAFSKEERIPEAYCSKCKDFRVQTKRMSLWRLPPVMIIHLKRFQFTATMRRKLQDLVVFPTEGLDLSRFLASTNHPNNTQATDDQDNTSVRNGNQECDSGEDDEPSNSLYDLYGVVHHHGALSAGHYVASLKSEVNGQWRLFNDAQIFDIHVREVIDPSAYILFYVRRDVAKAQLSDYWDVSGGNTLSDEDMDDLLKGRSERCVVS